MKWIFCSTLNLLNEHVASLCVQFVLHRRGLHPGHRSPARPMGCRQGDAASHRSKFLFIYIHFFCLFERLNTFPMERGGLSASMSLSHTPLMSPPPCVGKADMSQPHPWTLSHRHHSLLCVSIATGTNRQSYAKKKRERRRWCFFCSCAFCLIYCFCIQLFTIEK